MADDPIDRLRLDLKEGLAGIRTDLSRLVTRELHDAQLGRVNDRVDSLRKDFDRLVEAIEKDRATTAERRAADRRVMSGAFLAAGLGIVMQLLSSTGITP